DLVKQYPTYEDKKTFWRLPTRYHSVQARDYSKEFPLVMTSGRLVEFEGGGEETRSIAWLAELQQEMFCEINPGDANDRAVADRDYIWVHSPSGARLRGYYPEGASPYVLGEAVNTAWTYGYDAVTMMQETKVSLCQIEKA